MKASCKRGLGAVVAIVATALLIAAADGGQVATSTLEVPAHRIAAGSVRCPAGGAVLSQGFAVPGFAAGDDGASAVRFASHRSGPRTVTTAAYNFGALEGTVRGYAYCSRRARAIEVVRDRARVGTPAAAAVARPTCPAGSRAVSGGFAAPGFAAAGPDVVTLTSRRVGVRTWRVEALSLQRGEGAPRGRGALVGFAYCLADPPRIAAVSASREVAPGELERVVARCPQGTKAIAGGFDGDVRPRAPVSAAGAVASRRLSQGSGWSIKGTGIAGSTATLTVYAYCAAV